MKDMWILIFILALFFIFDGKPDIWDKLHAHVLNSFECEVADDEKK